MIGRNKAVILLVAAAALAFLISGCDEFSLYNELDGDGGLRITAPGGISLENLTIIPGDAVLPVDAAYTFTASGGSSPYFFYLVSGSGSIEEDTGLYTAPSSPGEAVVSVIDSAGSADEAGIEIVEAGSSAVLAASPAAITLYVDDTAAFTVSGGTGPYTWSLKSGGGAINSSSGLYTAPHAPGTEVVRVTDSLENTSEATITVIPLPGTVIASPSAISLYTNNTLTFTASEGVGPFTWQVVSGTGTIDADGLYTAPAAPDIDTVRVTDSLGDTSDATVTVYAPFSLSPSAVQVTTEQSYAFTASGGKTPYVYAKVAGGGIIDPDTGEYTAPAGAGSATVSATDYLGNYATAAVTITLPTALIISPVSVTLIVDGTATFTAVGGIEPYTFSVLDPKNGSIIADTGVYTAGSTAGTDTVRVTDGLGTTSDAAVTFVSGGPLSINPVAVIVEQEDIYDFYAEGGTPPYIYSVTSGGGSVHALSGLYTASTAMGPATVRVTDSVGTSAQASLNIAPAAPTNLVADGYGLSGEASATDDIILYWTDNATGEYGFRIERKKLEEDFYLLTTVGPDIEFYYDDTGQPNTLFIYRIKAYWEGLESEYSNISYDDTNAPAP